MYPLKFKPRLMERIWGGSRLGKPGADGKPIGESWEVSGVEDQLSVVANGMYKGNDLQEMVEIYMGDLVGEKVYDKFGIEFPLLIKIIDAQDTLSVQVHPGDELARDRHSSYGKTEMWYVVDCQPGAFVYLGFREGVTQEQYLAAVENHTLDGLLNRIEVSKGDVFLVPSGTIHSIGKGILLVEVQQTSDVTYRIYDWGRMDKDGNMRELHTELAGEAIDFTSTGVHVKAGLVESEELISCGYFTVNKIELDGVVERDNSNRDSFVAYVCAEGKAVVDGGGRENLNELETVVVAAEQQCVQLSGQGVLLEVFIK